MIDWQQEALRRKKDIINDLSKWIQINSVHDEHTISKSAPFGAGIEKSFRYIMDLAKRDDFNYLDDDGYACHIDYGSGEKILGVLGHVDVVNPLENWQVAPFSGEIQGDYIYGRGTQDNKGPMIAAYYGMKIIKDLKLPIKNKIRFILGGNEELEWKCVEHYFKRFPQPDFGFTPDGDFPVINGEKGIVTYEYTGDFNCSNIISFNAGVTRTSVPGIAHAIVTNCSNDLISSYHQFLRENKVKGEVSMVDKNIHLSLEGRVAHAASPFRGINAATLLMLFLSSKIDCDTIRYFSELFNDTNGQGLGIEFVGEKMGALTSNLGIVEIENNSYKFIVDIRYPLEIDYTKMNTELINRGVNVPTSNCLAKLISGRKGIYLELESNIIKILRSVYEQQTNDYKSLPLIKGGDTYARASNNTVCFGMLFPESEDRMHQVDERVNIDELVKAVAIYAQAIYELANF